LVFPSLLTLPFGEKFSSPAFLASCLIMLVYCALMMYFQGIMRLVVQRGTMWFALAANMVEGGALVVGFNAFSAHGGVGLAIAFVMSYLVRIAVTVPWLVRRGIVSTALLLERKFVASLILFSSLVAWQLGRL
jgi:hypothetical protein